MRSELRIVKANTDLILLLPALDLSSSPTSDLPNRILLELKRARHDPPRPVTAGGVGVSGSVVVEHTLNSLSGSGGRAACRRSVGNAAAFPSPHLSPPAPGFLSAGPSPEKRQCCVETCVVRRRRLLGVIP